MGGNISIHALLAESDAVQIVIVIMYALFLSTLSLRRATMIHPLLCDAKLDFYPRSPCGERLPRSVGYADGNNFYPRSPCGERLMDKAREVNPTLFLSTLSLRRATTFPLPQTLRNPYFYPRSPCGERRSLFFDIDYYKTHFYPRSPCGERLASLT